MTKPSAIQVLLAKRVGLPATASKTDVCRAAMAKMAAMDMGGRGDGPRYFAAKCTRCGDIFPVPSDSPGQRYPQHDKPDNFRNDPCPGSGASIPADQISSSSRPFA